MSIIAYARMTRRREESRPEEPGSTRTLLADGGKPTPVGKATIDAFAALVPAEILIAHATILQVTTETDGDVTRITEPGALRFAFWSLLVVSMLLYAIAKAPKFDPLDGVRVLIPAASFVGWTMVQKATAFDAVFSMNAAMRITIPVLGGLLVAAGATALAYKADEMPG